MGGFLTLFILALAFIVLIRSMVGHLRKVRYQAEREAADEREAAERAGRQAAEPTEGEAVEQAGRQDAETGGSPGR
jgi:hypothetical protein